MRLAEKLPPRLPNPCTPTCGFRTPTCHTTCGRYRKYRNVNLLYIEAKKEQIPADDFSRDSYTRVMRNLAKTKGARKLPNIR